MPRVQQHPGKATHRWGPPPSTALTDSLSSICFATAVGLLLLIGAGAFAGERAVRVTVTDTAARGDGKAVSPRAESPEPVRAEPMRAEPVPTPQAPVPEQVVGQTEPTPAVDRREPAATAGEVDSAVTNNGDNIELGIRPIRSLTVDIGLPTTQENQSLRVPLPIDVASGYFEQFPAAPPENSVYIPWMLDDSYNPPLNFCYRPLYFEDVNLERYGYSWGIWQPAVSTVKFYANAVLLPYRMITQPPCKCTYHAHLSRPGGPAPRERQVPKGPFARFKD